jgi:hypothetical protein
MVIRVADRRAEARYDGSIDGSYTLSSRRLTQDGLVQVFACRTRSLSPLAALVTAPVVGEEGELLTAHLNGVGILRGRIEQRTDDGFHFEITASPEQRRKLALKIQSLRRRIRGGPGLDRRGYRRHRPLDPRSAITMPDGQVLRCFVIDISRSGAAVSVDWSPAIGTPVVLGALAARVVRYLDIGFSV